MTARGGPGGRIAPDGRTPRAKGVGRNAKRHDLEKPKATLHGTDLQQGEVSAMEQGQRIAPIQQQGPATPRPPSQGQSAPTATGLPMQGGAIDALGIAKQRLQGTIGQQRPEGAPKTVARARGWSQFFGAVAKNPQASPGMRTRARQQQNDLGRSYTGPQSTQINFAQADKDIDAFLTSEGF